MSNIPNEGYALTISGLLRKRAEILADLTAIREKAASLTNDLHSMDRVLMSLGYTGDLDAQKPSQRTRMFVRGELRKFVLDTLREAGEPLSSRELAIRRAQFEGKDPTDRKLMMDITSRVSRTVNVLSNRDVVRRVRTETGGFAYELAG